MVKEHSDKEPFLLAIIVNIMTVTLDIQINK